MESYFWDSLKSLNFCELSFYEMNFSVSANWDSTKWISQFLQTEILRNEFLSICELRFYGMNFSISAILYELIFWELRWSLKSPQDRLIDATINKQTSWLCNSLLILCHKFEISFLLNLLNWILYMYFHIMNKLQKCIELVSFMHMIHSKSFSYHILKKIHLILFMVCQMLCFELLMRKKLN